MLHGFRVFGACLLGVVCLGEGSYAGVSTYLPLDIAPRLERDIDQLAVVADIPNLIKPYSVALIRRYLSEIEDSHPSLYRRLKAELDFRGQRVALTHASVEVRRAGDTDEGLLPNQYGQYLQEEYAVSARGSWAAASWVHVNLGLQSADKHMNPAGSFLSFGADWAQFDIGYRDRWHSPFKGIAQLLSSNAETMLSAALSNVVPIDFWGTRINYEFSLARMSPQPVKFGGTFTESKPPLLAGIHMMVEPVKGWSIGASRMFQFAGGERERDFNLLARAFVDPKSTDNNASADEESGNQVAALMSRMNFTGNVPFSVSIELATEDVGNASKYVPGNSAITAGIYFPMLLSADMSLAYEYSAWQTSWYVNEIYQDGYSYEDAVLGHWAFQPQQERNAAREGRSQFLAFEYLLKNSDFLSVELRYSQNENTSTTDFEDTLSVQAEYAFDVSGQQLSTTVYTGKDYLANTFWQFRLKWFWR